RDGADQQGLGQARHPDEQAVTAAEQGHEQLFDHLLLADDDLADLLGHLGVGGGEVADGLGFGGRCGVGGRRRWRDLLGGAGGGAWGAGPPGVSGRGGRTFILTARQGAATTAPAARLPTRPGTERPQFFANTATAPSGGAQFSAPAVTFCVSISPVLWFG